MKNQSTISHHAIIECLPNKHRTQHYCNPPRSKAPSKQDMSYKPASRIQALMLHILLSVFREQPTSASDLDGTELVSEQEDLLLYQRGSAKTCWLSSPIHPCSKHIAEECKR